MLAAIAAFLSAFPQFVRLGQEMWTYLNKVSGNDPAGYIARVGEAFSVLNAAKTQEEHAHAAKALADLIAHGTPQ